MNVHALTRQFDSSPITAVEFDDKPCVIARELGAALGYADNGGKLVDQISREWSAEFVEGKHFTRASGRNLLDLKSALELTRRDRGSSPIGLRARSLILLTLPGIDLVLLKTEKPIGAKLRAWIVDEVFPALRESGSYALPHALETPSAAAGGALAEDHRVLRERRLARKERLAAAKEFAALARTWNGVTEETLRPLLVSAYSAALEQDLKGLLPAAKPTFKSPAELASEFGVTANRVGRAITELGLRGKEGVSLARLDKSRHSSKTVTSYTYSPEAVAAIRAHLVEQGHAEAGVQELAAETETRAPAIAAPAAPAPALLPPGNPAPKEAWKRSREVAAALGTTAHRVQYAAKELGLFDDPAYVREQVMAYSDGPGSLRARPAIVYSPDAVALIETCLRERGFLQEGGGKAA